MQDSDFRFYPTQPDPEFGYVLHPADLATNKIMAAAGRREPRDIVDLVTIAASVMQRLRQALEEADAFVRRIPTDQVGVLFLKDGQPVQPDPDHLGDYVTRGGARGGHWPSSPEIGSALLEHYGK